MPQDPLQMLTQLKETPRMFATSREAYLMRVTTILEMTLDNFDLQAFYERHLERTGNACVDMTDPVPEEWANAVTDHAIGLLPK